MDKLTAKADEGRDWRELNSSELLIKVVEGTIFVDGIIVKAA